MVAACTRQWISSTGIMSLLFLQSTKLLSFNLSRVVQKNWGGLVVAVSGNCATFALKLTCVSAAHRLSSGL